MAGRGGLNLTHSENLDLFIQKYGPRATIMESMINDFTPQMLTDWCEGLGQKTFIGSSGRVFPESFKASPLLKAWITRLTQQGVQILYRHDWHGWQDGSLVFETPDGKVQHKADATLLALGGASWPRLGSDGSWVSLLQAQGVDIAPLQPSNCGFCVNWSDIFQKRAAGQPLKPVIATFDKTSLQGEIMITEKGLEGGLIYALSAQLREDINQRGQTTVLLDLKPDLNLQEIEHRLSAAKGSKSLSTYLSKTLNLSPVAIGLLMERPERLELAHWPAAELAHLIKHYPVTLESPYPIDRAISSAGGVLFDAVDDHLMLRNKPGVFVAGEMLDWEAPTGGYLLQASFATGVRAAKGIKTWLS